MNLSDVDGLKHLAWAVYNGVYMPGDLLAPTGHHNWERIITETTLHLIFRGKTNDEHCKPLTIAFLNAEQATKLTLQQGLLQPGKKRPWTAPVAATWAPTVQSMVNVLPQVSLPAPWEECRPHRWIIKRVPMGRALSIRPADVL